MECHVNTCPHREPDDMECPIAVSSDPLPKPGKRDRSLIVSSMEIGRVLADHGKVSFRAHGTCMFPCVRPGDLLTIDSRTIEQVHVGDIVVFRRNDILFGHRAIAMGILDGKPYVLTRPDRSSQGSDGPLNAKDILGVITSIKRHNDDVPLNPQPLRGSTALHAAGWEWWNWKAFPLLIKGIYRLQHFTWYKRAATILLDSLHRQRRFVVRVPLSIHQSHDLYREFPAEHFVPEQPLWQGKPALRWILNLHFMNERTAAGMATVAWHPDGCPRGEGWMVEDFQIRTKYRGAGLEDALFQQAKEILAPWGMKLQRKPK